MEIYLTLAGIMGLLFIAFFGFRFLLASAAFIFFLFFKGLGALFEALKKKVDLL